MNLYCTSCHALHKFTATDVERIVYTLQGQLLTAAIDLEQHNTNVYMPTDEPDCLKAVLQSSTSIEEYGEHVDATVDVRRAMQAVSVVGLTNTERALLTVIARFPGCTTSIVSSESDVPVSSDQAGKLLERLRRRGLVAPMAGTYELTDRGHTVLTFVSKGAA